MRTSVMKIRRFLQSQKRSNDKIYKDGGRKEDNSSGKEGEIK